MTALWQRKCHILKVTVGEVVATEQPLALHRPTRGRSYLLHWKLIEDVEGGLPPLTLSLLMLSYLPPPPQIFKLFLTM